jgi:hypothetical protein
MMTNEQMALGEAVKAIYFDDSSDYGTALWQIVQLLGGNDAVGLLEADASAAYNKYAADIGAPAHNAQVQAGPAGVMAGIAPGTES